MADKPTEMVQRVSDAIARAIYENPAFENIAREAMRAMLEPTKEMCAVGNDEVERHTYTEGSDSSGSWTAFEPWCAAKTFEAMIRAALGEM